MTAEKTEYGYQPETIFYNLKDKLVNNEMESRGICVDKFAIQSKIFDIEPGYIGIITLFAPEYYKMPDGSIINVYDYITFCALQMSHKEFGQEFERCYGDGRALIKYRRWPFYVGSMGKTSKADGSESRYTPFNKAVVYWGKNPITGEITTREYILHPGKYIIVGSKCNTDVFDKCDIHITLELSRMHITHIPEFFLPPNANPLLEDC